MATNDDAWKDFSGDFNSMSDHEVKRETAHAIQQIKDGTAWLKAWASWEAAGRPRAKNED